MSDCLLRRRLLRAAVAGGAAGNVAARTLIVAAFSVIGLAVAGAAQRSEPSVEEHTGADGRVEIRINAAGTSPTLLCTIDLSKRHCPATKPTEALERWRAWRFGAFVCFNTNQFTGKEICRAKDPKVYSPAELDIAGWIKTFKRAGMKYAVLTTRHTSGFLLWDSPTTTFDVAASGNPTDVVKEFVTQCNTQGVAPGFYYCMWGGKKFQPARNARAVILAQLSELGTRYGKIPYFWIDMMNWAPADLGPQQVYDAIKSLQPDSIVLLNQHVQDGRQIKYFPTDILNGELVPPPAEGHHPKRTLDTVTYYLPFEYSLCSQRRAGGIKYDPLGPSCWFTYGQGRPFAASSTFDARAICDRIKLGWDRGADNVLLSVAPDYTGRLRPADVEQLLVLGKLLQRPKKVTPAP